MKCILLACALACAGCASPPAPAAARRKVVPTQTLVDIRPVLNYLGPEANPPSEPFLDYCERVAATEREWRNIPVPSRLAGVGMADLLRELPKYGARIHSVAETEDLFECDDEEGFFPLFGPGDTTSAWTALTRCAEREDLEVFVTPAGEVWVDWPKDLEAADARLVSDFRTLNDIRVWHGMTSFEEGDAEDLESKTAIRAMLQSRRMNLECRNCRLADIAHLIRRFAEVPVVFSGELKSSGAPDRTADFLAHDETLERILDRLVEESGLAYRVERRCILLFARDEPPAREMVLPTAVRLASKTVTLHARRLRFREILQLLAGELGLPYRMDAVTWKRGGLYDVDLEKAPISEVLTVLSALVPLQCDWADGRLWFLEAAAAR